MMVSTRENIDLNKKKVSKENTANTGGGVNKNKHRELSSPEGRRRNKRDYTEREGKSRQCNHRLVVTVTRHT